MPTTQVKVRLRGKFFAANMPQVVVDMLNNTLKDAVAEGERDVKTMARPRPAGVFHSTAYASAHGYNPTGHYRRSIHGDLASSLHGRIHDSNVVYGPWLEGVGSRNDTTRFKGYAIFRNVKQGLIKKGRDFLARRVREMLQRLR